MVVIDTPCTTVGKASAIKNAGFGGVIRYISPNTPTFHSKQLGPIETTELLKAGLKVGLVFEKDPTHPGYFTPVQAERDARDATIFCQNRDVPPDVPVFFTVDYDADPKRVEEYLQIVHAKMKPRLIGVYGSGKVCKFALDKGYCHYTWLAQSKGWAGYDYWRSRCNIAQGAEDTFEGLPIDRGLTVVDGLPWWSPA